MVGWIFRLSRWSAVLGGLMLALVMLLVVVSVSGRALVGLGLGPVPGDFELVEVGTAVAVFLFLPWCYLRGGHASVDLLYERFPASWRWFVTTLADGLMLALWLALTERLFEGMSEKREYLETTFILLMPIWWGYALCLVGGVIGCLAYVAKLLIQFRLASWPAGWTMDPTGGH
jgi:TRAP-type C4-dicarboxylate transport system permease small subunit